jgi:hypothetical protein
MLSAIDIGNGVGFWNIEVVHPVQHAQQRRLAAAGRADHARHLPVRQVERDRFQRAVGAVEEIEVADRDARRAQLRVRVRRHRADAWLSSTRLLLRFAHRDAHLQKS